MKIERDDIALEAYQGIAEMVIEKLKPIISGNSKSAGEDALLTIDEAANFLKTSKGQIYQWTNNAQHGMGNFPYYIERNV